MNDLLRRRREMMTRKDSGDLNTSPKIAEYGKCLGRSNTGINTASGWCYTEWYDIDPVPGTANRLKSGGTGMDSNHTYQWTTTAGSGNWDYRVSSGFCYLSANADKIRFSIKVANLSNCYAYIDTTGQIIFAGKNTPYYGYKNINDMPTGE